MRPPDASEMDRRQALHADPRIRVEQPRPRGRRRDHRGVHGAGRGAPDPAHRHRAGVLRRARRHDRRGAAPRAPRGRADRDPRGRPLLLPRLPGLHRVRRAQLRRGGAGRVHPVHPGAPLAPAGRQVPRLPPPAALLRGRRPGVRILRRDEARRADARAANLRPPALHGVRGLRRRHHRALHHGPVAGPPRDRDHRLLAVQHRERRPRPQRLDGLHVDGRGALLRRPLAPGRPPEGPLPRLALHRPRRADQVRAATCSPPSSSRSSSRASSRPSAASASACARASPRS